MGAVGEHEQRFGGGAHGRRRVEHPVAKVDPERRVARFEGKERVVQLGDPSRLGALAADVDAFKDEKDASLAQASSSRCVWRRRAAFASAPWATFARLAAPVAFVTDAFFVDLAAFFVDPVFFVVLAALVAFTDVAAFLVAFRTRVEGSALRRSARSSLARSSVMVSGVSPIRRVAFVSPSVT